MVEVTGEGNYVVLLWRKSGEVVVGLGVDDSATTLYGRGAVSGSRVCVLEAFLA